MRIPTEALLTETMVREGHFDGSISIKFLTSIMGLRSLSSFLLYVIIEYICNNSKSILGLSYAIGCGSPCPTSSSPTGVDFKWNRQQMVSRHLRLGSLAASSTKMDVGGAVAKGVNCGCTWKQ
uniref:Uncharacterized protein n=1 Tax=Lactuca sativa TaxID=4236 RepID=A0A9R1XPM2_LACSA|nr:hypothetical protein LSAT_V11C200078370 [Lactuca sativa]